MGWVGKLSSFGCIIFLVASLRKCCLFYFFRSSTEPRYKKALSRFIFSGDDVLPKVNGRAGIFLMIYKIHRRGGGWGRVGRVVGGFGCVAVKLTRFPL